MTVTLSAPLASAMLFRPQYRPSCVQKACSASGVVIAAHAVLMFPAIPIRALDALRVMPFSVVDSGSGRGMTDAPPVVVGVLCAAFWARAGFFAIRE